MEQQTKELADRMRKEFLNTPLIIQQGGGGFKWKIVQIVSETGKCKSAQEVIDESQKIIDFINS